MRGRPSRTALSHTLIASTRPNTTVLSPSRTVECSVHSMATGDSATRGTPTTSLGSSRTPHASASLVRGREVGAGGVDLLEQRLGREADGELPVASTLRSESFRPTEVNWTTGGVDAGHRVEGVRRQVEHAVGRPAADPGDGPGDDDGVHHAGRRRPRSISVGVEAHAGGGVGGGHVPIVAGGPARAAGVAASGRARSGCRARCPTTDRAISTSSSQHRHRVGQRVGPRPAAGRRGHHRPAGDARRRSRPAPRASRAARRAAGSTQTAVRTPAAATALADRGAAHRRPQRLRVAVAQRRPARRTSGRRPAGSRRPAPPRPPARFTARSSAMSSSTSPRTAACPPARSYPRRVSTRNCPLAAASDGPAASARPAAAAASSPTATAPAAAPAARPARAATGRGHGETRSSPARSSTATAPASASGNSRTSASTNTSTPSSGRPSAAATPAAQACGLPSQPGGGGPAGHQPDAGIGAPRGPRPPSRRSTRRRRRPPAGRRPPRWSSSAARQPPTCSSSSRTGSTTVTGRRTGGGVGRRTAEQHDVDRGVQRRRRPRAPARTADQPAAHGAAPRRPAAAGPRGRPATGTARATPQAAEPGRPSQPACASAPPRVIQAERQQRRARRRSAERRGTEVRATSDVEQRASAPAPASSQPARLVSGTVGMPGRPGAGVRPGPVPGLHQLRVEDDVPGGEDRRGHGDPARRRAAGADPAGQPVGEQPARPRHHQPGERHQERHAEQGRARGRRRSAYRPYGNPVARPTASNADRGDRRPATRSAGAGAAARG